ncbi:sugar ABC transporter substrate-binding protein [Intestinibacillus massiliensis]|nr:sugar ABC transporter substrate-binding protein [Intestinibacillus massiliensis]
MKKRLLALGLAGIMMLGALAGCAGTGEKKPDAASKPAGSNAAADAKDTADTGRKLKIGMSLAQRDQFLTNCEQAALKLAEQDGNVELKVFDANNDISAQISQVQTCASDDYDAMIVALCNNDSGAEIIQAAGDMPVAFFNRMPTDLSILDEKHCYVGMDESEAGKAQGEYLASLFKGKGPDLNAVLLMGPLGQDSVSKRTDGVKAALKDAGFNVTYVYEDTAEWDRAKAMDKFTQFMGTGKPYDMVICNNDDMALGVAEAMKTSDKGEITVPIVGIDATENGCNAVKDGTLKMTVNQNPIGQGEGALKCAVDLANGKVPSIVNDQYVLFTPADKVTTDNVDEFLKSFEG